jgi:hypothetical protein
MYVETDQRRGALLKSTKFEERGYLDDQELLDVVAGVACVHAVPRGVCQSTADGPHDGYSGFGGSCWTYISMMFIKKLEGGSGTYWVVQLGQPFR